MWSKDSAIALIKPALRFFYFPKWSAQPSGFLLSLWFCKLWFSHPCTYLLSWMFFSLYLFYGLTPLKEVLKSLSGLTLFKLFFWYSPSYLQFSPFKKHWAFLWEKWFPLWLIIRKPKFSIFKIFGLIQTISGNNLLPVFLSLSLWMDWTRTWCKKI